MEDTRCNAPPVGAPKEAPPMQELKLVTMTVETTIGHHLNLEVVSRYIPLDDVLVGVKCRGVTRGTVRNTESKTMKNVCSFNAFVGKAINTKLFNNGKINNVGCVEPNQGVVITQRLVRLVRGVRGHHVYHVNTAVLADERLKKNFKEVAKQFCSIVPFLLDALELTHLTVECFTPSTNPNSAYHNADKLLVSSPEHAKEYVYMLLVIDVAKRYYAREDILQAGADGNACGAFIRWLHTCSDPERTHLSAVFPAYIDFDCEIPFTGAYKINLINKGTHCNFLVNRDKLTELLAESPEVHEVKYDNGRFSGVMVSLRTPPELVIDPQKRLMMIIVFNTGKINITSTQTHEQVDYAFRFIERFCKERYDHIVSREEYNNHLLEYQMTLPDKHRIDPAPDGTPGYILNKRTIIMNPRNVRLLAELSLLDKYRPPTP